MQDPRPSGKPSCPNHGCPLTDIPYPIPSKGVGICPVRGCPFEFEVEVDGHETKVDTAGNKIKATKWVAKGDEVN